jgi:catechol 2,3-dioxygenase-like lactoylglutathione lyase family enzyme
MVDFKLEVVVLPVADVDRAKAFWTRLGFREDVDYSGPDGFRVVHFTPPGSPASLLFGTGVTDAAPGKHEEEIGHADPEWPVWYATYMAREAGLGT